MLSHDSFVLLISGALTLVSLGMIGMPRLPSCPNSGVLFTLVLILTCQDPPSCPPCPSPFPPCPPAYAWCHCHKITPPTNSSLTGSLKAVHWYSTHSLGPDIEEKKQISGQGWKGRNFNVILHDKIRNAHSSESTPHGFQGLGVVQVANCTLLGLLGSLLWGEFDFERTSKQGMVIGLLLAFWMHK